MILSVEDDVQMTSLLRTVFELSDYPLIQAKSAKEALTMFLSEKPELVILDLGLPDMDGLDVIRKIRGFSQAPILVLSARSEPADKIEALDLGADDYLAKDELLARIRVICRRLEQTGSLPETEVFVNGGLEIRYQEQEVRLDGKLLHLTPMEYRILVLFSRNAGKVLTRNFLTTQIWNSSWSSDMTNLRVYMTMLRKKLDHRFIETSFGVGYKMVREEQEAGL